VKRFAAWLLLTLAALALLAAIAASAQTTDERLGVIEAKVANLDRLNDSVQRLQDRIGHLESDLASANAKLTALIAILAVIGTAIVGQIVAGFKKEPKEDSLSEIFKLQMQAELQAAMLEKMQRSKHKDPNPKAAL
jgi:phage shock protein A